MFVCSLNSPQRSRAAWLTTAALHTAAVVILATFDGNVVTIPARSLRQVVMLAPKPAPLQARLLPPAPVRPKHYFAPVTTPLALPPLQLPAAPEAAVKTTRNMVLPPPAEVPPAPKPLPPPPQLQTGGFAPPPQTVPSPRLPVLATVRTGAFGETQAVPGPVHHVPLRTGTGFAAAAVAAELPPPRRFVGQAGGLGSASLTSAHAPSAHVAAGTFGDTVAADPASRNVRQVKPDPPSRTPVEITFQPRPAYTEEARRLHIEGQVLVEVALTSSGEVRVLRVVRGIGHGLDESAMAAAAAIRFRPATQSGQPVDSTATVRVNFELAF